MSDINEAYYNALINKIEELEKQRNRLLKIVEEGITLIGSSIYSECNPNDQCADCNWIRKARKEVRDGKRKSS